MPSRALGIFSIALLSLIPVSAAVAQTSAPPREFTVEDSSKFRHISDPQLSPEGKWVAYTVRGVDVAKDKMATDLWMSRRDGSEHVQLTTMGDVTGSPRWSPDGRKLSFLAKRGTEDEQKRGAQVWILDRNGGEAKKLTDLPGGVSDYAWSPDSRRLVLAVDDFDPASDPEKIVGWARKTKPPIVIDRYHFKQDREGYLGTLRTHLALVDVEAKKAEALTAGIYSETSPSWSPDGKQIAFFSNRAADPDRSGEATLFVIDAATGAVAKALTTTTINRSARPAWSPDGKSIAFLSGDPDRFSAYQRFRLSTVGVSGGNHQVLTDKLDRGVQPGFQWTADGKHLVFSVADDRASYLARIAATGGAVEPLTSGRRTVSASSLGADGVAVLLSGTSNSATEVHVLEGRTLRKVTQQNDAWMAGVKFSITEDFASTSKDGTEVHGLIAKPASYTKGKRYPTILLIHGGPNSQDAHELDSRSSWRELLAARGYVVLLVNYRGSAGRGDAFQKAIFADWGNKEVVDLQGAVDWAIATGIADPDRLGLGGWSYGGILTNYTIAQDTRFKAAVSGASSSNQITMFGTDQYIRQYEKELGPPWKSQDLWLKLSYPFFKADRIKTPTLFLSGEKDFNVPVSGTEQMYQALKLLGVDTQLVIYPGQFHGISVPSYQRDVMTRLVGWFDKYLMKDAAAK